jgi:hypothetical protein
MPARHPAPNCIPGIGVVINGADRTLLSHNLITENSCSA